MTGDMSEKTQKTISIVLPVFNEEESLPVLHQEIIHTMDNQSHVYEIIFVDDGSTDRSAEIIRELANQSRKTKGVILRHRHQRHENQPDPDLVRPVKDFMHLRRA